MQLTRELDLEQAGRITGQRLKLAVQLTDTALVPKTLLRQDQ